MSDPWANAFDKAIKVEEEGAKDFSDVSSAGKKRTYTGATGSMEEGSVPSRVSDNWSNEESEFGGFCQPRKLAKFVSHSERSPVSTKPNNGVDAKPSSPLQVHGEDTQLARGERNMVDVCAKQICRTWLKYTFLQLGQPCDDSTCLRQHKITVNRPELLYKDFSFKGLTQKQRKDILNQLKKK